MARPKRQAARRAQLVDAASRAIAARGLADLRIKDIADSAGMVPGSVLYYYPDIDALLVEVHEAAVDRFYVDRLAAAGAHHDPAEQLAVTVAHGIPTSSDDLTLIVLAELHAGAGRNDTHARLLTQLWEQEVSLYEEILARGQSTGRFRLVGQPRAIAETVVALEDAFDLHLTGRNGAVDPNLALTRIRDYLAVATSCRLPVV
jgi:AcrR family transcriptional regulator